MLPRDEQERIDRIVRVRELMSAWKVAAEFDGDFPRAIASIEEAIALEPENWMVYTSLADTYVELACPDDARRCLQQALACNPREFRCYANMALMCEHFGQPEEALQWYLQAMSRLPVSTYPSFQGEYLRAIIRLGEMLDLEDVERYRRELAATEESAFMTGYRYYQEGLYAEAAARFEAAVAHSPEDPRNRLWLGVSNFRQQRLEEAMGHLAQVVEIQPHSYNYYWLGRTCYERGEYDRAIAAFREAALMEPTDSDIITWLGHCYLEQQEPVEARGLYLRSLGLNPDSYVLFSLGRTYYMEEDFESARAYFYAASICGYHERILEQEVELTDQTAYNFWLGMACTELEEYEDAVDYFQEALRESPDSPAVLIRLAEILYFVLEEMDEALGCLYRALSLDPAFADAYFLLGMVEIDRQNFEAAITAIHRAREIEPHREAFLGALAYAYAELGEWQLALGEMEDLLAQDPDNPEYQEGLAYIQQRVAQSTFISTTSLEDFNESLRQGEIQWLKRREPEA